MKAVCHTVKVKEANRGGRLYSAIHTEELENGSVIFLGALEEGEMESRKAVVPTTELIAKETPMLVMNAEMIYDESTKSKQALGNYTNVANKAFAVVPLSQFDEIELSKEAFTGQTPSVGKFVVAKNGTAKWEVVNSAPSTGHVLVGKITSKRNSHLPVFVGGDGNMFPQAYELFNVAFTRA